MTSVQPSTRLGPNSTAPRHNGAGPEINNLQSGRIGSGLVTTPITPSVPPTEKKIKAVADSVAERLERTTSCFFRQTGLSLYSTSPDFNLLSDEEYSKEEEEEEMAETMEQYMSKTRTDYGSGVARPKIDNKDHFELKGQFLKELRENTFSGSDNEDANEHIEKVLKIVDLFHVPNITMDQLML
ncbi:hypothetical protein Tco_1250303 [Tanacetum coccineum]